MATPVPRLVNAHVPTLVVSGQRSPDEMRRVGDLVARATGGHHHVQAAAGHAAHLIGRPFRDVLCAHIADAEAEQSWNDPVVVQAWDPAWSRRYDRERAAITGIGDRRVVDVAHVGSTAVEGLHAKPIVDLMVGVDAPAATRPVADRMRALGYAYRDDPGSDNHDGHMFLLRRADGQRRVHAHVVVHGARWWRDHVAFRDLLRADPRLRASYRALKLRLAGDHADDREAYTDAKTTFVIDALTRAARSPGHAAP